MIVVRNANLPPAWAASKIAGTAPRAASPNSNPEASADTVQISGQSSPAADLQLPRPPLSGFSDIAGWALQFGVAGGLACAGIPLLSPVAGFVAGGIAGTYSGVIVTENLVMAGISGLAAGAAGSALAASMPGSFAMALPVGLACAAACGVTLLIERSLADRRYSRPPYRQQAAENQC